METPLIADDCNMRNLGRDPKDCSKSRVNDGDVDGIHARIADELTNVTAITAIHSLVERRGVVISTPVPALPIITIASAATPDKITNGTRASEKLPVASLMEPMM